MVIEGKYFNRSGESRRNYKYKLLEDKAALIPVRAVIYVCVELQESSARQQKQYLLDFKDHEDIIMFIVD